MEDNTSGPAGPSTSDHQRQDTSPNYSTFTPRRQAGMAVSRKDIVERIAILFVLNITFRNTVNHQESPIDNNLSQR